MSRRAARSRPSTRRCAPRATKTLSPLQRGEGRGPPQRGGKGEGRAAGQGVFQRLRDSAVRLPRNLLKGAPHPPIAFAMGPSLSPLKRGEGDGVWPPCRPKAGRGTVVP